MTNTPNQNSNVFDQDQIDLASETLPEIESLLETYFAAGMLETMSMFPDWDAGLSKEDMHERFLKFRNRVKFNAHYERQE